MTEPIQRVDRAAFTWRQGCAYVALSALLWVIIVTIIGLLVRWLS